MTQKTATDIANPPLRDELFSSEQLHRHAISLADNHRIDPDRGSNRLLKRLADNERVLNEAYELVSSGGGDSRQVAPAGEWLLDNFHLVEEQIRTTLLHLPKTYSRELPCLLEGRAKGSPRVYDIALELISHADGLVDAENLGHFVDAYQTVTPLTLGELWAIPIMLRLALIENLRRVSEHIAQCWHDRDLAQLWVERFLAVADQPVKVIRVLSEMVESDPPFSNPFVEEFSSRMYGHDAGLATVQSWVQHRLADQNLTREQLQRADNQIQAAGQVSIGHIIGSIRHLSAIDWRQFVETTSAVEATLRTDPAGIYASMDFSSRDRYRHCVEALSRHSPTGEGVIADEAIRLAKEAAQRKCTEASSAHVGYYLIGKGQAELERVAKIEFSLRRILTRAARRVPIFCYVGSILTIAVAVVSLLGIPAGPLGWEDWRLWLLATLGLVGASQMAVALVNLMTNLLIGTRALPRLDYSKGIPKRDRTMVVVPTLLSSPADIDELLENLELRYVGNRDPNLSFALLTDYCDAPEVTEPDDQDLITQVRQGIEILNSRHPREGSRVFHLFHRPRTWNEYERVWMGYERKRGKLEQFNELLRGGPSSPFSVMISDPDLFPTIRYVITLDSDTSLPRDAARKLIGTMAHPLNRPRFDPKMGRFTEGYAILQPRTPISLVAANRSLFARLSAGEAGIDPYTREVSDVYQDLFSEGSYVGKGIYDVDAFRQSTAGRFPENLILSHDLLECSHARSALVSDIELYEDHPSSFTAEMSRRHRWIRGDWQIAGWLFPRVPGPNNKRSRNPVNALGRWKILDNLRRSLMPPALLLLLITGWFLVPQPTGFWTGFVLLLLLLPVLLTALINVLKKPPQQGWRVHLGIAMNGLGRETAQATLMLASLPYRTLIHLHAILASAGLMLFTRRGLLIWHTKRYAKRNRCRTRVEYLRETWIAPLVAIILGALLATFHPAELIVSGPLLLTWLLFPAITYWISRPIARQTPSLSDAQRQFLRNLARQTWRYFEVFANERENWLAPDNFQEVPEPIVASRTSPTNIGMGLLANLTAHDFGYISVGELLDRTDMTLASMERMEHHRGHLYNWYDTRTLEPLPPVYVSTVDSGNLAGALLTLRAGLMELKDLSIRPAALLDGLRDTLQMITTPSAEGLRKRLQSPPAHDLTATLTWLQEFSEEADTLPKSGDPEQQWWNETLARQCRSICADLEYLILDHRPFTQIPTLQELAGANSGVENAADRIRRIDKLARRCEQHAEMDFAFLHDRDRDLLSIGYNVTERSLDPSFYDLLASEARLASFILVAQGHLHQDHWFTLGRQLTTQGSDMALLSWSGSMFEYLMPLLLMPSYEHTLLDETYRAVVDRQIEYARQRAVPWGISESCCNLTDAQAVYQYSAFGVPGLGLKRGLSDDLVIAPYATALALMVSPREACENLERLVADGYAGGYGLIEAIDFTPSRVPRGDRGVPIQSYMAHHQGMSLLSLVSVLLDKPMQRRFLADPYLKASELLLCERIPKVASPLQPHAPEVNAARTPPEAVAMRVIDTPHTAIPEVHLRSNGRLHVMITNAGGGYTRWKELAVTRWREDATSDGWGSFCYLRDTETGSLWSNTYQPTRRSADIYEAIFVQGRAEFRRSDEEIYSHTELAISTEDDVEVRRITLTNLSTRPRSIELTSYAEVVIAPPNSDLAHPAFSNLFVQTEILADSQAILCTRRARRADENPPWMFHLVTTQGASSGDVSFETDRAKFIGRTRSTANPAAFDETGPLSNTDGSVLDPIVSIRQSVAIDTGTSANWHVISGMAETREGALHLIERYRDPNFAARTFEMAWSRSHIELQQLRVTQAEAQLYEQMANSMIYANSLHRASTSIVTRNHIGQPGLWALGISGDLPILLMRIADVHRVKLVKQVLQAHAYWRGKGLKVDLVILNEDFSGYRQVLQDQILGLIAAGTEAHLVDQPGGVFLRRSEDLPEEDRVLLQTVARTVLTDNAKTLAQQIRSEIPAAAKLPRFEPTRVAPPPAQSPTSPASLRGLTFQNGFGGFTPDGREYVIRIEPGKATPAPWSNVLANARIGSVVSESGAAYTWVDNSHEFRLTPWNNDPISDPSGEAFYVRDEETGQFWSPSPLPATGDNTYTCRHGFGYSVFEYEQEGIRTELWTYVAVDSPVKFVVVKVRNNSDRDRRLSVTGYWEWVLGEWRHSHLMHIVTDHDPASGTVFARNDYNLEFSGKTVFVGVNETAKSFTGDRTEFIGRNGNQARPAAMKQARLSGKTGASLDPCAALQVPFDLASGTERELVFILGAGNDHEEAQQLVQRFKGSASARASLEGVWDFWKQTLGTVHAETPDPAVNCLVNGWLEYQTLACRYWGRSGYYQSGGAYGFRDQLQDTTALLHAAPWTTREHIIRAAGRQFVEGDVQHWWHPPTGRGVRTHFSDDYLWLPYCVCRYVKTTGDTGILDEKIPFLEGRSVNADEESYCDLPQQSGQDGTLYEHCVRAINYGLRFGKHGLPLIGCGDWNDGMNLVGEKGRGESVWLAFFLYDVMQRFTELARSKDDTAFADECIRQCDRLQENIDENAWDGEWYRRAYFDDGTPLGSEANEECKIDSIAQSWAVLSGAGDPDRARDAMEKVEERLVRHDGQLIQLFDPPFDKSELEPGYIKGYIPGVRENGGQYTHAAIWTAMAFAELGETEKAWELCSMLNPISHASDPAGANRYKVEPYVISADIYSMEPHVGRGGWSWYTGSAGWMYRLIVETLFGLEKEGDQLHLNPRLPQAWDSLKLHYRYRESFYHLQITRLNKDSPEEEMLILDGGEIGGKTVPLSDDHRDHTVEMKVR